MLKYGKPKPWAHLYNTAAWKRLRRQQLDAQPLCLMCMRAGKATEANVVDHRIPHKGERDLFFDARNLQSLCKLHHDSAKAKEESRGVVIGCDVNGVPLDPNSHWNRAG